MTNIRISLLRFIAVALCAMPIVASAQQQAFTSKSVNLRAGPGRDYPLVAGVGPGAPVTVMGCVSGYVWCDVIVPGNNRGWIYAQNLTYPYQGNNVPIVNYGMAIGLPIVAFSIGTYWGSYYRNRPWYGNQSHWANRPGYRPRPPVNRPHPSRPGIMPPPRPGNGGQHGGNRPGFGQGGQQGGNRPQPARPKPPGNGGQHGGNGGNRPRPQPK
ncbi:SH3 domain-containing protein [Glaciimonas soli]|uniref:SH3 domain-containing protein n=1 Tax=Glaciimonas soli TaxID=2590999 RepID=A0A843YP32_9BURK|nr:SH3 domain-containing protein [Glaciimonas soli]MQQ99312.1 SH3 domain-containing protein [Glaciimonas soli]